MNQFIKLLRMNQVLRKTAAAIYGAKATAQKARSQKPQMQENRQKFKRDDVTYTNPRGQSITVKGPKKQKFLAGRQEAPQGQDNANIGTPRSNGLVPGSWWSGSDPNSQARGRMKGHKITHPLTPFADTNGSFFDTHSRAPTEGYVANLRKVVNDERDKLKTVEERAAFDNKPISRQLHNAAAHATAEQIANKYTEPGTDANRHANQVSLDVTQAKRQHNAKLDGSNIIFYKRGPKGQKLAFKDNKGRDLNIKQIPAGYQGISLDADMWDQMSHTYQDAGRYDKYQQWIQNKNNWSGTQNNLDNFFQDAARMASMNRNNYNNVV